MHLSAAWNRVRPVSRVPLGVFVLALWGCETPSSSVDGGDLMGLFEGPADAGKKAVSDGGPVSSADAAAPEPQPAPTVRTATTGMCVAPLGEPGRALRRTMGRPPCREAQIREWRDAEGSPRYACVVAPKGVETRAPLPLVIFFHGEADDPASALKKTGLRKQIPQLDMTNDPAHRGFIVLAPQGRALAGDVRGALYDVDYLDEKNVDIATVDHFVDALVGENLVDQRRIYAVGDGLGGGMAATYAMMRSSKVAAFAAYGAEAPPAQWACPEPPPPAVVLYRACDAVAPCANVEEWLRARDKIGAETSYFRLGIGDEEETNCAPKNRCTDARGKSQHARWPKGREVDMLQGLARHVLAAPR